MKQNLRIGEGYAPTRSNLKQRYIRYISLLVVLTTMCLYARAQEDIEWTPAASGQSAPTAKGLQVGDTVPDELWRKPLILWSAIDNSTKAITLNDYRGKVIILDFWATWCLNCVAYLPHLSELNRQFGSQLASILFTLESRSELWQVFDKKKPIWTSGLEETFQSVVDVSLAEYFPRRTLPHVVVIDQEGTIVAITRPTYLKSEIIAGLINGESDSYLPLKRYRLDSPLLEVSSAYADVEIHGPLYYSTLSGFIDGVGHSAMWKKDTVARTLRFSISNTFVKKLYLSTKQFGSLPNQHNRTILEVPNPSSMAYLRDSLTDLNRRRQHFYSYESINPLNSDKTAVLQEMKRKLDAYLGLHGRIEKRTVPCVILRRLNGITVPSEGAKMTLKNLVSVLNKSQFSLPPVVDETGMESCPKPVFPSRIDPGNIEAIRVMLSDCGLDVTVETRELEMFVLGTRNGPTYTSDQLVLTKYGYVPIN